MKTTFQKVQDSWEKVFGHPISADDTFSSLHGNAKRADQLFSLLETTFDRDLQISPTIAYDHPTVMKQAIYIDALIQQQRDGRPIRRKEKLKHVMPQEPMAIIGMSCRFPGGMNSDVSISFSQANMLSPNGECRSFMDLWCLAGTGTSTVY